VSGEALPYGLRDVRLWPLSVNSGLSTAVDLPNSRVFSFSEAEEYAELRGDDKVVATRGKGSSVDWELEAGGISLEAYTVIAGGTLTITGTGPTLVKTWKKKSTDQRPEFRAEGQAMSESGGDFHATLFRCKANDKIEGSFSDGEFLLTSCSGVALGARDDDDLYEFVQNATVTAIDDTPGS
jgi:hypothetical protein